MKLEFNAVIIGWKQEMRSCAECTMCGAGQYANGIKLDLEIPHDMVREVWIATKSQAKFKVTIDDNIITWKKGRPSQSGFYWFRFVGEFSVSMAEAAFTKTKEHPEGEFLIWMRDMIMDEEDISDAEFYGPLPIPT